MRNVFLMIPVLLATGFAKAQPFNTINLHFTGMAFEQLDLVVGMADDNRTKHTFPGSSENGKDWTFSYPDSLYERHASMSLHMLPEKDTIAEGIAFSSVIDADTLFAGSCSFSRGAADIQAEYLNTMIYPEGQRIIDTVNQSYSFIPLHQHRFLIPPESDRQLLAIMEAIKYRYCMPNFLDTKMYTEQLASYVNLTRKYPESHFLSYFLFGNHTLFRSKEDIKAILDSFNDDIRRSYFGTRVSDFLASPNTKYEYRFFENTVLPLMGSGQVEPIVKDPERFNLVLFSASWCAPCREEIPMLKEVYGQYGDNLNMTYVSMDEEATLEGWVELMKNEDIPWRSLMAGDKLDEVRERYFAHGIPHNILVYPGGSKAEIMDMRSEDNYSKLVRLIGN